MKVSVKNMVCPRCIYVVEQIISDMSLPEARVTLGEVDFSRDIPPDAMRRFEKKLEHFGFERIEDQKKKIIERVKALIIEVIRGDGFDSSKTWSERITENFPYNYTYISNLFSAVEGITLEQYIIRNKVERVKELLLYGEKSIKEIAFQLDYSSAASLSNQFKKHTGFSPSEYRNQPFAQRKGLVNSFG